MFLSSFTNFPTSLNIQHKTWHLKQFPQCARLQSVWLLISYRVYFKCYIERSVNNILWTDRRQLFQNVFDSTSWDFTKTLPRTDKQSIFCKPMRFPATLQNIFWIICANMHLWLRRTTLPTEWYIILYFSSPLSRGQCDMLWTYIGLCGADDDNLT